MGRLSKIVRLPAEVRELIGALRRDGHTIDEILAKLHELACDNDIPQAAISRATLGRHVKSIDAMAERLRHSRAAAEAIMAKLGEGEGRTARLNIELMHASLMDLLAGADGAAITLQPDTAMLLSRALRDLAAAAKTDADRELKVAKETAGKAVKAAERAAERVEREGGARLDPKTLAAIREEIYGIVR